jgi:excinuclease ABC subunit B
MEDILLSTSVADGVREGPREEDARGQRGVLEQLGELSPSELLEQLTAEMYKAAKELDFETAAILRDRIDELRLEQELAGPKSVQKERRRASRAKNRGNSSRRSK